MAPGRFGARSLPARAWPSSPPAQHFHIRFAVALFLPFSISGAPPEPDVNSDSGVDLTGPGALRNRSLFRDAMGMIEEIGPGRADLRERRLADRYPELQPEKRQQVLQYCARFEAAAWLCVKWNTLEAGDFRGYRLKVYGLVENPVELSLDDLRALGKETRITLHHCIQGWSGIADWGGVALAQLGRLVRPTATAKALIFYSFGEGVEFTTGIANGQYYDSLSIENALHPHTLLAYEMNDKPLGHPHGAPLRLRVENQLGVKMVKWIQAIEFVEEVQSINEGEGGYAEDREYFGELANI